MPSYPGGNLSVQNRKTSKCIYENIIAPLSCRTSIWELRILKVKEVSNFLRAVNCDRLILNGDILMVGI